MKHQRVRRWDEGFLNGFKGAAEFLRIEVRGPFNLQSLPLELRSATLLFEVVLVARHCEDHDYHHEVDAQQCAAEDQAVCVLAQLAPYRQRCTIK